MNFTWTVMLVILITQRHVRAAFRVFRLLRGWKTAHNIFQRFGGFQGSFNQLLGVLNLTLIIDYQFVLN